MRHGAYRNAQDESIAFGSELEKTLLQLRLIELPELPSEDRKKVVFLER